MTIDDFQVLQVGDQISDVKTGEVKTIYGFQDTQHYRIAFTSPKLDMRSCISDMIPDGAYQSCTRWAKIRMQAEGVA